MAFEDFNPGKLNKRISIVSFASTSNPYTVTGSMLTEEGGAVLTEDNGHIALEPEYRMPDEQDDFGFAADDDEAEKAKVAEADPADEPTVVLTCWAMVTDETGTKAAESGTEFATARRRFLIRHTTKQITTDMMVSYNGSYYAIVRPPCTYGDSKRYIEIWTERKRQETWRA